MKGEKRDRERVIQLKEQIRRYENELKETELRADYLTAKRAVGRPVVYSLIALLATGAGIHSFYEGYQNGVIAYGILSVFLSILTLHNLYKTISAVEYAALRPARTIEFAAFLHQAKRVKKLS